MNQKLCGEREIESVRVKLYSMCMLVQFSISGIFLVKALKKWSPEKFVVDYDSVVHDILTYDD